MCVRACMRACVCVCACVRACSVGACVRLCDCVCATVCLRTHMCSCVYACMRASVYVFVLRKSRFCTQKNRHLCGVLLWGGGRGEVIITPLMEHVGLNIKLQRSCMSACYLAKYREETPTTPPNPSSPPNSGHSSNCTPASER